MQPCGELIDPAVRQMPSHRIQKTDTMSSLEDFHSKERKKESMDGWRQERHETNVRREMLQVSEGRELKKTQRGRKRQKQKPFSSPTFMAHSECLQKWSMAAMTLSGFPLVAFFWTAFRMRCVEQTAC